MGHSWWVACPERPAKSSTRKASQEARERATVWPQQAGSRGYLKAELAILLPSLISSRVRDRPLGVATLSPFAVIRPVCQSQVPLCRPPSGIAEAACLIPLRPVFLC